MQTVRIQPKTDIERINDYLIETNPQGVKKVLLLNGFNRFSTIRDMQISLLELVKTNGGTISQLLAEHPDYELIVADYLEKTAASEPTVKKAKKKSKTKEAYSIHSGSYVPMITFDFNLMVQLLMFLVCVWLVFKIFNKD
jgi:hypothetical protein